MVDDAKQFIIEIQYTEELLKRVVLSFWKNVVGLKFLLVSLFCAIFLGVNLAFGDRSWIVGALAVAVFLSVLFPILIYVVHYRASIGKFRRLRNGRATYVFTEATIQTKTATADVSISWSEISELWKFDDYWLLFFSKSQFSTLPISLMTEEVLNFIQDRAKDSGVKVINYAHR